MLKNVSILSVTILLLVYFGLALVYPGAHEDKQYLCTNVQVEIKQEEENRYITEKDINRLLQQSGLDPVGKNLSEINTDRIEAALEANDLIRRAECYKTAAGSVKLKIYQRTPLLRVIANKGNYYIDTEGKKMPVPANFSAYVPVATGFIEDDFARTELFHFALFLQKNKFWNAQIEQIHVTPVRDIELTPRVGSHQIILGKIEDHRENLDKLKLFYKEGLSKVGWNKYSKINLKYKNQIVCTKN
ncbi:MAG: cell division protein FtsQ [Dysgonamonadaceae bacterium]|jgi:cell division protein FtsQ|nr:cell division protein FtsQ [Dysgonamonadaceae bacterium]